MEELEEKLPESKRDTWVFNVNEPKCICGSDAEYLPKKRLYKCRSCNAKYSLKDILS
jgi:hypothetical protein